MDFSDLPKGKQAAAVPVRNEMTNGLGVAGFVVSLVGIFLCGFISPIGLILSAVAMARPPRGMAIAGLALGLIGTTFLCLFGFAMFLTAVGVDMAKDRVEDMIEENLPDALALAQMSAISEALSQYRIEHNEYPPNLDELRDFRNQKSQNDWKGPFVDPWGNDYRYERINDGFSLWSIGKDKLEGTEDDIKWDQSLQDSSGGRNSNE